MVSRLAGGEISGWKNVGGVLEGVGWWKWMGCRM